MRYRKAAILSAVLAGLIVGMFAFSAAVWAIFLPSLRQGLPNPIPGYERALLEMAVLCVTWKWILAVLAPPISGMLFFVAAVTNPRAPVKR